MRLPAIYSGLNSRELVLTRILHASPKVVWAAWTQRLPEWWGPHGMTTPFCEMDLRPGGVFRTMSRAPDGAEYESSGVFLEVVPCRRLVFTDAFESGWRPSSRCFFTSCIELKDLSDGRTQHTVRARHWTEEACRKHMQMGFHTSWNESLDRLESLLSLGFDAAAPSGRRLVRE